MAKKFDSRDYEPGSPEALALSEIGHTEPIEPIAENDFVKAAALEAFMNELVTITVHQTAEDGSLDIITPNVNGTNQPIIRGVSTPVKRKYVEALARSRTPRMVQHTPDASRPHQIVMKEDQALSYPFSVDHDPNPRGGAWLKAIIDQRA